MAVIAHLSDVHFGRHDPAAVAAVLEDVADARPDLVVISGDLTQRARRAQFREARAFLREIEGLGLAWLAVPGNHDVPLYNVVRRFAAPLRRYRHYITPDLEPRFDGGGVAVRGVNTARALTISDGRVSTTQIAGMAARFANAADDAMRVLVTHHPLVALPWGEGGASLDAAGRAARALEAARGARVDMLLAGHHHRSFAGPGDGVTDRHGGLLVVQAGTATSTRTRNENNSYNLIRTGPGSADIEVRVRDTGRFTTARTESHRLEAGRWAPAIVARAAPAGPSA